MEKEVVAIIMLLAMSMVGVAFMFLPTKIILIFDAKGSYYLEKKSLKNPEDKEKHFRHFAIFYKCLGGAFLAFSLFVIYAILSR